MRKSVLVSVIGVTGAAFSGHHVNGDGWVSNIRGGCFLEVNINVGGTNCNICDSAGGSTANAAGFRRWQNSIPWSCPPAYEWDGCTVSPLPDDLTGTFSGCTSTTSHADPDRVGGGTCGISFGNGVTPFPRGYSSASYNGTATQTLTGFDSQMAFSSGECEGESGTVPFTNVTRYDGTAGTGMASATLERLISGTCELTIDVSQQIFAYYTFYTSGSRPALRDEPDVGPQFPAGQFAKVLIEWKDSGNAIIASEQLHRVVVLQPGGGVDVFGEIDDETIDDDSAGENTQFARNGDYDTRHNPVGAAKVVITQTNEGFSADGNVDRDSSNLSCNADLLALAAADGADVGDSNYVPWADLNADGTIDSDDYAVLSEKGCPADFDCDGDVDDDDFLDFSDAYNILTSIDGDFNGDGLTDDLDYVIFSAAYSNLLCPERPAYLLPGA